MAVQRHPTFVYKAFFEQLFLALDELVIEQEEVAVNETTGLRQLGQLSGMDEL